MTCNAAWMRLRVTPDQIATAAGDLARTELRRARSRVLEHS